VKRLAFLQRLLTGLADSIDDHDVPHFVAEARALQLEETDGVGRLVAHQRMLALAARGPEAIDHASDGRAVTTAMPSP